MTKANVQLNKQIKDLAFFGILAVIATNWFGSGLADGLSTYLIGGILIGMNIVRAKNHIPMNKFWFLVGAFIISLELLEGATLMNPIIFPLFGLMVAANAIYEGIARRYNS